MELYAADIIIYSKFSIGAGSVDTAIIAKREGRGGLSSLNNVVHLSL